MSGIETILVPLDGSGFAERALPAALNLARLKRATIHLVRVHTQIPLWYQGAEVVALSPEMEEAVLRQEQDYLGRIALRVQDPGIPVRTAVVKGEIVPALTDYAETTGVDLVVMTSHGWGGIRRAVLGSVADHVVRTLSIPVLIVTPGMTDRMNANWPRRILVPLDGSGLAESVLEYVRSLGPREGLKVFLVSVVQTMPPSILPWASPPEVFLETPDLREEVARNYLNEVVAELRADGWDADSRMATGTKVAREILKVADMERCDLVTIATHGAGGLDRLMFGSVTDQVVRHSHVPILVLRPVVTPARPRTAALAGVAGGGAG